MPTPFSRSSDSSNRLVSSRCPECGAPVDFRNVAPDQLQVKCSYCGTLINIPGRTPAAPPAGTRSPQRPAPAIVVTSNGKLGKSSWGCASWMTTILVLAVVGIGIWSTGFISSTRVVKEVTESDPTNQSGYNPLSFANVQQALTVKPRLVTAPYILHGDDTAATQMVVGAYQDNGSIFVGFDPVKRLETWRTSLLSEKYYEMGMASDATHIYIADGATLMALDRNSGKTLWQSSLANNLQTGCDSANSCLQHVSAPGKEGDKKEELVVSLARDGTMQAFAGANGAPAWSRRLNSQPRQFMVNGNQVIVVDNDDDNWAVVLVLNAGSGELLYQLQPGCDFNGFNMRPHASDEFLVTPDGSSLLIVGSGTYTCAWRYNLGDGSLAWQYQSPDVVGPLPFSWSSSSLAFADPILYFTNDEDGVQIYALDTQTEGAEPQSIYQIKGYALTLQYTLGDLLLVSATPSYATDEVELWALDRKTGERRWQHKLGTTHTFDEWVTHPADKGIFVSVCSWNDDNCRFQVLDTNTGASGGEVSEKASNSYNGAGWLGNQGYLTIDGQLYAIDLNTAQIKYTWP
jgi:outer membrane protein assembly factor BamB